MHAKTSPAEPKLRRTQAMYRTATLTIEDTKPIESGETKLPAPAQHSPLARPLCRASMLLLVAFRDGANLSERAARHLLMCAEKPRAEAK